MSTRYRNGTFAFVAMRNTTSLHGAACASHRRGSLNKSICYRFLVCVDTYNTGKANKNPLDPMRKREERKICLLWWGVHAPLFPRMKQSPKRALSCPSEYSSVCSMAMFKYPSKQANTPRYSTPEFSLTRMGRPMTDFKKSEGDRLGCVVVPVPTPWSP